MRIRRKKLKRPANCQKCGAAKRLDFHHPDYGEPDEGYFVCRSCHGKAHHDPNYLRGVKLMRVVDGEIVEATPKQPEPVAGEPFDASATIQAFYRMKGQSIPADYYHTRGEAVPQ